jgi:hypothetical protein
MNELRDQAGWYNALTDNCTTSIRTHVKAIDASTAFDWRILVNGHADQMIYERGMVDTALPFAQLRAACIIDPAAQAADQDAAFSERIREGVPGPSRDPLGETKGRKASCA